jgi:hypothetical protein
MPDSRVQRRAVLRAGEPVRTISLQEHIRIAHERPRRLCICGTIEVVLGRAFTARGVHVEEG